MFGVPQFIDVEDKVAGPLTWKQLLWMIGMGAVLLTIFNTFDPSLAIVFAIPTVLIFVAFAFYKPNGFPLTTFVFYSILFIFRPKVSVWERPTKSQSMPKAPKEIQKTETTKNFQQMDQQKLRELAHILDSKGK